MATERTTMPRAITLASRASQLAQIQTNVVLSSLQSIFPSSASSPFTFTTSFMSTAGDKNQSQALHLLGGKSLWTKELEVALKERLVDMLVHSLKDVPTTLPEGCIIGAVLEREDPVDCLVVKRGENWKTLGELPPGSAIGTSSVRRVAQLRRNFPNLKFLDVRGNLNTRIAKLDAPDGPYAALILAKAGLVRLGMSDRLTADIPPPTLYHAVSQGALAVEIRSDDEEAKQLCMKLTHWETQWKCMAERACLRVLEGGCSVPVGMTSSLVVSENDGQEDVERAENGRVGVMTLTGCVTAIKGDVHVEYSLSERVGSVKEAEAIGERLAKVLLETGAKEILDDINKDRKRVG